MGVQIRGKTTQYKCIKCECFPLCFVFCKYTFASTHAEAGQVVREWCLLPGVVVIATTLEATHRLLCSYGYLPPYGTLQICPDMQLQWITMLSQHQQWGVSAICNSLNHLEKSASEMRIENKQPLPPHHCAQGSNHFGTLKPSLGALNFFEWSHWSPTWKWETFLNESIFPRVVNRVWDWVRQGEHFSSGPLSRK